MKTLGYTLLVLFLLLSLACSGGVVSTAPLPRPDKSVPKGKQLTGRFRSQSAKGAISLEVAGVRSVYNVATDAKVWSDADGTVSEPSIRALMDKRVVATFGTRDGKEVIVDLRPAKLDSNPPPLLTGQTRIEGKCKGATVSEVIIEVGGVDRRYTSTKESQFYIASGDEAPRDIGGTFFGKQVVVTLEKKDGKDIIVEMRPKK